MVEAFLLSRDEEAFRLLYRRHAALLYRVSYRLLRGDEVGAEEAVQDVWVRAIGLLPAFRWDSSLSTWLTGIAINRCREMIRTIRSGPLAATAAPSDVASSDTPMAGGETGPARVDLQRAIARLPDGYREVLVLHDVEGYSHEEIAGMLGISAGTSKSQLSRARRAVRERLTDNGLSVLPGDVFTEPARKEAT